jgi:hypothetical protein
VAAVSLSADYGKALQIIAAVVQQLDGERPTITGHLCVALQWAGTETFQEPALINNVPTWQSAARFRMLVDQV